MLVLHLFQLFRRSAAALPGMDSRDKPESGEGFLFITFCYIIVNGVCWA